MLARSYEFLSVIIFSIAAFGAVEAQIHSSCTTLQETSGECVPILTCQSIVQLIEKAPKPLPAAIIEGVRKVHCRTLNKIPHVCCERGQTTNGTNINPMIRSSVLSSDADVQSGMAILSAIQCGQQRRRSRRNYSQIKSIARGKDSFVSEFSWMALLIYDDGLERTLDCGGSLITDRYVLTAAHCIRTGLLKKLVGVRLGEHNTDTEIDCLAGAMAICAPPVQEIGVEEAIYHRDYRPSRMANDIGLIRLINKAIFRSNVRPICLPINESKMARLQQMTIAGWGRMDNGQVANILQKAVVPVRANDHCQRVHKLIEFTDKHLCAGSENDIETCKGDSGGPIFARTLYDRSLRWIQYGIVSAGSILCGSNYPGIYVRLTSYVEWIAANIKV